MIKTRRGIIALLRKGGRHKKSVSGQRQKAKRVLKKEILEARQSRDE